VLQTPDPRAYNCQADEVARRAPFYFELRELSIDRKRARRSRVQDGKQLYGLFRYAAQVIHPLGIARRWFCMQYAPVVNCGFTDQLYRLDVVAVRLKVVGVTFRRLGLQPSCLDISRRRGSGKLFSCDNNRSN
jgi:hypothetical protein